MRRGTAFGLVPFPHVGERGSNSGEGVGSGGLRNCSVGDNPCGPHSCLCSADCGGLGDRLGVFLHLFTRRLARSELCILLFFCGLLHYYLSRADWTHCRLLPIAGALLLPFLVFPRSGLIESEARSPVSKGTGVAVLLAASFVCFASPDLRPAVCTHPEGGATVGNPSPPSTSDRHRSGVGPIAPDAPWLALYPDTDELQALRYLRANTSSTDAIFSGVPDHSTVSVNNLRIYWLADRPVGVRALSNWTRDCNRGPGTTRDYCRPRAKPGEMGPHRQPSLGGSNPCGTPLRGFQTSGSIYCQPLSRGSAIRPILSVQQKAVQAGEDRPAAH